MVVFSSTNDDGTLTLVFENETNNIERSDLKHLFERFWRKDPEHSTDNHTGPPQAFVKAPSELLNIDARNDELAGGVLAVWLTSGDLSLGSMVGFVTVLGIAARNGIMLVVQRSIPSHAIEYPMTIVILGGLHTCTALNLFMVPPFIFLAGPRKSGAG